MTIVEILCAGILSLGIGGSVDRGEYACKHVPQIVKLSKEMNFRPELMISLIHYESRWYPHVVSRAKACGLTQVLPKYTGGKPYPRGAGNPVLTCEQLKDPVTSIDAGARALRYWLHRYGRGSEKIGLCGYNAGFRCRPKKDVAGKYVLPKAGKQGMAYSKNVRRMANRLRRYVRLNTPKD